MRILSISAVLALLAAAMLVAAGCTTAPPTNQTTVTTTTPTDTGPVAPNATATRCAVCEAGGNLTPTASATVNETANASFIGTTWEWTALEAGGGSIVVDDPAKYTIVFGENGAYGINADCNVGGGDYTREGSAINLTPPITTLIWCGEESRDQAFLAALANVSSYEFDDEGRLLLRLAGQGDQMVFAARAGGDGTTASPPFVNATWQWIAQAGSDPVQVPAPSRYTIAFASNGTYAIRADCNTGSGTFSANGSKVTMAPPALTLMYCGDDSLDGRFLAALSAVTGFEMDAQERLVLYMANPAERLVFEKEA